MSFPQGLGRTEWGGGQRPERRISAEPPLLPDEGGQEELETPLPFLPLLSSHLGAQWRQSSWSHSQRKLKPSWPLQQCPLPGLQTNLGAWERG